MARQEQESEQQFVLSDEDRMRRRRKLIVIAASIVIIAFGTFSNYGVLTRVKLESHRKSIQDTLNTLGLVKDSLRRRSERLRYDTLEIERIARENYGMAKPNEEVYIVREAEAK